MIQKGTTKKGIKYISRLLKLKHRPAGGQPFRDVAARTAAPEHPTTVYVGCGACT